ncbi:MAG TPA: peptidyl-prolyl cis-trans isomerase [Candidatus Omnitrophota bacterium]|nr:peptidyl-prolyl cis-trans isomerase [Candidatus Omnitrophota bacterium]HPT07093.1 peptidyl-prolyl cis-trans isomerase [Candidatus Omnitrophota bacterium]
MRQKFAIAVVLLTSAGLVGCNLLAAKPKEPVKKEKVAVVKSMAVQGPIVATVNNMPITLEDLNDEVEAYNRLIDQQKTGKKITTREDKINYLKEELIRRTYLYQEALARGLDRDEKIQRSLEKVKMELLVRELLNQLMESVQVSNQDARTFYDKNQDYFMKPEERRISEIAVPSEQEAKDIYIQVLQGADFAGLAKEKSKASSASAGGDVGFITPDDKRPVEYYSAAFAPTLDVGKITNIFKAGNDYYILKLEEKRGGQLQAFSELQDRIKAALVNDALSKKIKDLVGKLSAEGKLDLNEGEIK